jgi:hypothetical protein
MRATLTTCKSVADVDASQNNPPLKAVIVAPL